MTEFRDWSITASANTGNAVDGYFKENMAYSDVNDAARELQAIMARHRLDNSGVLVTTGSTSSYVLSINATLTSYQDGDTVAFQPHVKNDGASTLRLKFNDATSLSDRPMVNTALAALTDGDLVANSTYVAHYNSASENFRVVNVPGFTGAQSMPGDLSVGGSLAVAGNVSLSGGVHITNDLKVRRDTSLSGTLAVWGESNFHNDVSISGTLAVTGELDAQDINAHGDVSVSGALSVQGYNQPPAQYWMLTSDWERSDGGTTQIGGVQPFVISANHTYAVEACMNIQAAHGSGNGFEFTVDGNENPRDDAFFLSTASNTGTNTGLFDAQARVLGGNEKVDLGNMGQYSGSTRNVNESTQTVFYTSGTWPAHATLNSNMGMLLQQVSAGSGVQLFVRAGSWMRVTKLT